jgi:hypothetical protein
MICAPVLRCSRQLNKGIAAGCLVLTGEKKNRVEYPGMKAARKTAAGNTSKEMDGLQNIQTNLKRTVFPDAGLVTGSTCINRSKSSGSDTRK